MSAEKLTHMTTLEKMEFYIKQMSSREEKLGGQTHKYVQLSEVLDIIESFKFDVWNGPNSGFPEIVVNGVPTGLHVVLNEGRTIIVTFKVTEKGFSWRNKTYALEHYRYCPTADYPRWGGAEYDPKRCAGKGLFKKHVLKLIADIEKGAAVEYKGGCDGD